MAGLMDRFRRPAAVPVKVEPVPFDLPAKTKDRLETVADVLHYLEAKYGGRSEGWKEQDGTCIIRLDFGDDRISGKGKTPLEAVHHLARRLGEKL